MSDRTLYCAVKIEPTADPGSSQVSDQVSDLQQQYAFSSAFIVVDKGVPVPLVAA